MHEAHESENDDLREAYAEPLLREFGNLRDLVGKSGEKAKDSDKSKEKEKEKDKDKDKDKDMFDKPAG